ncbi:Ig kappa chain V-I region Walker precursor [Pelobates cultripes]|uniref:Ig kappa chain V-I region Walker n=1 Tax=Pelobates cultripes TaxID=61616 RepID=A0AAD1TB49_PELCU|nr:Ig kappa chain V-I region Walker precursor [Pelobates cultripes]
MTLLLHRGFFAAEVKQTPLFKIPSLGENVSLICSHEDSSFIYKYWYRQEKGKALVFIGQMYRETVTMDTLVENKMSIKPDGFMKSLLTIHNFMVEDSAAYYCASSIHSEMIA